MEKELLKEEVWKDLDKIKEIQKEKDKLLETIEPIENITKRVLDLEEALTIAESEEEGYLLLKDLKKI